MRNTSCQVIVFFVVNNCHKTGPGAPQSWRNEGKGISVGLSRKKEEKKKKRCFFQYYALDFSPMLMKMHKCLLPDILYRVPFGEMKRHRKKKKHIVNCYKVKENEICFQLLAFKPVFPSWLNVLLVNRKSHGNNAGLKSQIFKILICRISLEKSLLDRCIEINS